MKLHIESVLPIAPDGAWDLFESDEFRRRLRAHTNMEAEVLDSRREGEIEIHRLRFTSRNELPTLVAKALGSPNLTYEQENRLDRAKGRLEWTVRLPVLTDRVRVRGLTTVEPHPQGCRRVVSGDVEVAIKLVGGQVEKAVVAEFEKSMTRAVEIARELIRER